jgi:hypothetical protein
MSSTAAPIVAPVAATPLPGVADRADPPPRDWTRTIGGLVSIVVLAVVVLQLPRIDLAEFDSLLPATPWFWVAFAVFYMTGPVSEWLIYRRLWALPVTGIFALMRKQVANEIVLGYSGEVQFYLWARRHVGLTTSPFGAVKDVSVLSALAGNVGTLAMMVAMTPLLHIVAAGTVGRTLFWSVGAVLAMSLAALLVRRTLFSLPGPALRAIFAVHMVRIAMLLGLSATMWHMIMPSVALGLWLVICTLRMMVSRLPFMPNKDVVLAGLVAYLLGRDGNMAAVMAVMAGIIVVAHLVVGVVTGAGEFTERWSARR